MSVRPVFRYTFVAMAMLLVAGCGGRRGDAEEKRVDPVGSRGTLTICLPSGAPAAALQELVRPFETQSLIRVSIVHLPSKSYHDQIVLQFQRRFTQFDLCAVMSHWRAAHMQKGYYQDLSEFLKRDVGFTEVDPTVRSLLCEYPPESGLYMAAPFLPNPWVWLYRADWLRDPEERQRFQERFGHDLQVPLTWASAMQVAEFFTRHEAGRYGVALPMSRGFDGLIFTWTQLLWAEGGQLGEPGTYRVEGHLNGAPARKAVEQLRAALAWSPPFSAEASAEDVLQHFVQGRVAMVPVPFSAVRGLRADLGERVGVTTWPAGTGGPVSLIPGYGLALSAKIPQENSDRARQFIRWFLRPDTQERWAELTGVALYRNQFDVDRVRMSGSDFEVFAQALAQGRPFWDVPVYTTLMRLIQDHVGDAVDGYIEKERALDTLTVRAADALRSAGLLQEF